MRQAIGIALAFQHDPELLILDEPTTGLDPVVREAFLGLVRDARTRGATVFLSSHVLSEVDRVADRVALIAHSRLRLVEEVEALRRRLPRRVTVRLRDGSHRTFEEAGDVGALLERLRALDPADVEIAPASLEEIFRAVVAEAVVP
jgi:ABC-2 type transport system ATP-binding protein